jgi:hypothetical protein
MLFSTSLAAQREQPAQPPDESTYSRKFFLQLRALFGRFRDADLDRSFDSAQPVQCSQLINDKGEWRTVAFFNEKRELGDWYRSNFDEVKNDLTVFTFKGVCRNERGPVQLSTQFPVTESIDAYTRGQIGLEEVAMKYNPPIAASFDPQTQAYRFDLPYLFLVSQEDNERIYSLEPPTLADRNKYAREVTDLWECKSVTGEAVTYQFLICRTTTQAVDRRRNPPGSGGFGSGAYFILSDGKEAASDVKLTFSDSDNTSREVEDASTPAATDSVDPPAWETPDDGERLLDLARDEFRVRFVKQSWTNKAGVAQALIGGRLTPLTSSNPASGADYCVWLPGSASAESKLLSNEDPDPLMVGLRVHDKDNQSTTSISFEFQSGERSSLGTLQCFFPRAATASSVTYSRWKAVVGENLIFEIRPL